MKLKWMWTEWMLSFHYFTQSIEFIRVSEIAAWKTKLKTNRFCKMTLLMSFLCFVFFPFVAFVADDQPQSVPRMTNWMEFDHLLIGSDCIDLGRKLSVTKLKKKKNKRFHRKIPKLSCYFDDFHTPIHLNDCLFSSTLNDR